MLSAQVGLGAPAASLLPFVGGPLTDVISRRIFSFQRSQEEIFLLACIREKTGILTTLLVQIIFDFFQNALLPLMDGLLRHPQPLCAFPFGAVLEVRDAFTDSYGCLHMQPVMLSYNQAYAPKAIMPDSRFQIVGRVL